MKKECTHYWMLDWNKYFKGLEGHYMLVDHGTCYEQKPIFPAKCYICSEFRSFTKEEWLEHLKSQGVELENID